MGIEERICRIRELTDIVAEIGDVVALRRTGSRFTGLCPFHYETAPSFSVNPIDKTFKCFGCGIGGDVIRFVALKERVSETEAILMLERNIPPAHSN